MEEKYFILKNRMHSSMKKDLYCMFHQYHWKLSVTWIYVIGRMTLNLVPLNLVLGLMVVIGLSWNSLLIRAR